MMLPLDELDEVVDSVGSHFDELRGANVLVTGASGLFGTWMIESFARANARLRLGATLTALVRDPARLRADGASDVIVSDVRAFEAKAAFSHVVHAATSASASLIAHEPAEMSSTIVDGTRRVLDQVRGAHRLLFTSSGAVYGRQTVERVEESATTGPDPLDRRSAYAEAKRYAELTCALSDVPCVVARGFAFVGPLLPLDAHFAIGNFLGDALAGRPIEVRGDGTALRSYLYMTDLASWLWTMLVRGTPGRAYNVGSEDALSIGALARRVGEVFGVPVEVRGTADPARPVERYVPSTTRAREELGLEQTVDLEEAIRRTASFIRRSE